MQNRIRFVVETLEAMIGAAGDPAKVGMKISPAMPFNDIHDDDPIETYTTLVKAVAPMGLGYLHVLRTPPLPQHLRGAAAALSRHVRGRRRLRLRVRQRRHRLGLGRLHRVRKAVHVEPRPGGALCRRAWSSRPFDATTFYSPGPKGYTDYLPAAAQSA